MKRSVAQAASARLAASLGALILAAAPALAGDAAQFTPLGFSLDGRYFAFEEFGVQDGSGFPFSNIFILDVTADKWAGGSPFRAVIEDEKPGLAEVRAEAAGQAARAIAELAITEPAVIIAMNADGTPVVDRKSLVFGPPGLGLDEPDDSSTLTLTTFPSTSTVACVEDFGFEPPLGFALTLKPFDRSEGQIHRDTSVPASRGCTVDYRLSAIVVPFNWSWHQQQPVAIVSVYSHGFEGPDRRFIAVPIESWP